MVARMQCWALRWPGRATIQTCLLLALSLHAASSPDAARAADAPRLTLRAEVWKRDVIFGEPILVRVELRNEGDDPIEVVPPYPWALGVPGALSIAVTDAAGTDVSQEPRGCDRQPWRLSDPSFPGVPLYRWALGPRETRFFWFDLIGRVTLDVEGYIGVRLAYTADEARIARTTTAGTDGTVWEGRLEAEAGLVHVGAPAGPDAPAFEVLRGLRTTDQLVLSSADRAVSLRMIQQHPLSRYVPYARYYAIEEGVRGPDMAVTPATEARLDEFPAEHPDFALAYRLPFLRKYREWSAVWHVPGPPWALPEPAVVSRAAEELVAAAEASGDKELVQRARLSLWGYDRSRAAVEEWKRLRGIETQNQE